MALALQVHLKKFDGPLGLLLYLIKKEEMDIFDININEITRQYLDYIRAIRELDLESAGEFVAMAATLIQIKSRMLLPDYQKDLDEGEEGKDPRRELVQRLLEYQKFKGAAHWLHQQPRWSRDFWTRTSKIDFAEEAPEEIELEANPLFSLISSFRFAVRNMKKGVHSVAAALQSIASRILELKDKLRLNERVLFRDLITAHQDRSGQILITFLSTLELGRLGFVSIFQSEVLGDIHLLLKRPIEKDVVQRVEAFESAIGPNGEIVASGLQQMALNIDPIAVEVASEVAIADPAQSVGDARAAISEGDFVGSEADGPALEVAVTEPAAPGDLRWAAEAASDEEILRAELELGLAEEKENGPTSEG
jgi:segregation and condensation protein A